MPRKGTETFYLREIRVPVLIKPMPRKGTETRSGFERALFLNSIKPMPRKGTET